MQCAVSWGFGSERPRGLRDRRGSPVPRPVTQAAVREEPQPGSSACSYSRPSCALLGIDVIGWLQEVWTQIKAVPLRYLAPRGVLQILQTSLNGLAYYGILAYAYPGRAQLWPIITA